MCAISFKRSNIVKWLVSVNDLEHETVHNAMKKACRSSFEVMEFFIETFHIETVDKSIMRESAMMISHKMAEMLLRRFHGVSRTKEKRVVDR